MSTTEIPSRGTENLDVQDDNAGHYETSSKDTTKSMSQLSAVDDQSDIHLTSQADSEDDDDVKAIVDLKDLDITSVEVDFEEIQENLAEHLEDEVVKQALHEGTDLRVFAKQVEKELENLERNSIDDYMNEAVRMAKLYQQVQVCDGILHTMEQLLGTFQTDLGTISGDIHSLQEESLNMSIKLKNRREIHGELSDCVSKLSISQEIVDTICSRETTITPNFENAISELHCKLEYIKLQPETTVAVSDIEQDLAKLNANNVQHSLLKHSNCFEFLLRHNRTAAISIRGEYIDTVSKTHSVYIKTYIARLMKFQFTQVPDREDVLAADDSAGKRSAGFFTSKPVLKNRSTTFSLGNRASVLEKIDDPIMVPHAQDVKEMKDNKFPYEELFRNLLKAIIDTGVREYLFSIEFFLIPEKKRQEIFNIVMGKSLQLVLKHLETHLSTCYDGIGIMLCICVADCFRSALNRQNISCFDEFFGKVISMLLITFQQIVMRHKESIAAVNPEKFSNADTRPHYIVRRYAEFSGAILGLNEQCQIDDVDTAMHSLGELVESLILSAVANYTDPQRYLVFVINNYDLLVSVLSRRTTRGTVEASATQDQLKKRINEYAEMILEPKFGGVITFVKKAEAKLSNKLDFAISEDEVATLIQSFAQTWKLAIDELDREVMVSFTNFKNGRVILQEALTRLVMYYERFLDLLKKLGLRKPGGWPDLVDRHHILIEVKKHKAMF
eukprot:gene10205-2362_t